MNRLHWYICKKMSEEKPSILYSKQTLKKRKSEVMIIDRW